MPPIVALTLCTIFVLFILRLERKQYPDASLSLWVPTIWLLLVTSKPLAIWFGRGGTSMVEGSALDRTVLSILFALGLLIIIKRNFNWGSALKQNPWVMLLIGFMLVSVLWSDIPYTSFKRWIRQLIAVVMVFLVASERDPRQALQSLFRRTIYILIPFSLLLIKYYPYYGVEYGRWSGGLMWVGVTTQKNGLALLCLFALFYLVWTLFRRLQGRDVSVVRYQTYIEIFILLLAIWLFTGPQHTITCSATSTVALIIGLVLLTGLLWLKKHNIIISANAFTILIAAIIVYGTVTPFVGELMFYDPSAALDREETLTGRVDIWTNLLPYALQKPILGNGFGGFWTDAMRRVATSSNAHNGYLDTILNTGFAGLIFWSMFLISNCRKAQRLMTQDFYWGILWFCFLLMAVVHNIAESSVISFTGLLPAILLFMVITSPTVDSKQAEFKKRNSRLLPIKALKNY